MIKNMIVLNHQKNIMLIKTPKKIDPMKISSSLVYSHEDLFGNIFSGGILAFYSLSGRHNP